jgi:hypothetical protein
VECARYLSLFIVDHLPNSDVPQSFVFRRHCCCCHCRRRSSGPLPFVFVQVMHSDALGRSMSSLSLNSVQSQSEDDWDRSLLEGGSTSIATPVEFPVADSGTSATVSQLSRTTPRNSIVFPVDGTPGRATHFNSSSRVHSRSGSVEGLEIGNKKRTLSDLFKLHSERAQMATLV